MQRRPVTLFLLGLFGLLQALPAAATPFTVRTSRPTYADSELARPVTIAKEWAEFSIGYQYRYVTQLTDDSGNVHPAPYGYQVSWLEATTRYGFTRNVTLFLSVPYAIEVGMTTSVPGESLNYDYGMGDTRFGFAWQVLNRESGTNMTSVAFQVDSKQPTGNQAPGGPGNRSPLFGTGTSNVGGKLIAKQRVGRVAAIADLGYTHKFSAVTQWVRDVDTGNFNGRIKPGDQFDAGLHLMAAAVNLGSSAPDAKGIDAHLGLDVGADFILTDVALIGHTANGINPGAGLTVMPCQGATDGNGAPYTTCSPFEALNLSGRLIVDLNTNWQVTGGVSQPVMSRNSGYFMPLEDLSQSYGTTFLGSLSFRW